MLVDILPQSLETLKNRIQAAIDQDQTINAEIIKQFVEQSNIQAEDLLPYADFDHPIEDGYGRKMIHDAGKFEIMAMSWNPGDYSSIHNHGYTQWGVVQVFGNVHHFIYKHKDDTLSFAKKEILPTGACTKVVNAMIHQMGNPSTGRYMTLHIYGCNEKDANVTADAKNYELELDRVSRTTGGAFFNLPEDQVYDFEPCPVPTDDVFLNYAKLLMDYYHRQEQTPEIMDRKTALLRQLEQRVC
ncbi:MAG: cysteine dioxygenase family protein [Bacteroidota bacterium]